MIHVVAVITAKPGLRDRILDAFQANVEHVHAEDGCIEYGAVVDAAGLGKGFALFGPDTFVVIEKWASLEALQAHAKAPHMLAYGTLVRDMTAERAIHVLSPVSSTRGPD